MVKKKVVKSILGGIVVTALSTPALATLSWDTCAVKRLGVSGSAKKLIKIDSCGFLYNNDKWLTVTNQENASLATLLTALSLGKKVKMQAHYNTANTITDSGSNINIIYLDQ